MSSMWYGGNQMNPAASIMMRALGDMVWTLGDMMQTLEGMRQTLDSMMQTLAGMRQTLDSMMQMLGLMRQTLSGMMQAPAGMVQTASIIPTLEGVIQTAGAIQTQARMMGLPAEIPQTLEEMKHTLVEMKQCLLFDQITLDLFAWGVHLPWHALFRVHYVQVQKCMEAAYSPCIPRRGTVYPPIEKVFAWTRCPLYRVRVVILGHDPYFKKGQANGLAFSVDEGVATPRSLWNIFKELGYNSPWPSGDLSLWADRGVLLLNTILTVQKDEVDSHAHLGWQQFTDAVIKHISETRTRVVFMLWGDKAKQKTYLINKNNDHKVLTAYHPSCPIINTNDGERNPEAFPGCEHFSKCNEFLGAPAINWWR